MKEGITLGEVKYENFKKKEKEELRILCKKSNGKGRGCLKVSNDLRLGAEGPTDKRSIGSVADNKKIIRQKSKKI